MNSIKQIEAVYDNRLVDRLALNKEGLCAFEYSAEWLFHLLYGHGDVRILFGFVLLGKFLRKQVFRKHSIDYRY